MKQQGSVQNSCLIHLLIKAVINVFAVWQFSLNAPEITIVMMNVHVFENKLRSWIIFILMLLQ